MSTATPPADPEAELLLRLLDHFGGPGSFVPFGTVAHLARLYVICDQQMKDRQWVAAYRTIMLLYRIERDLKGLRPPAPSVPKATTGRPPERPAAPPPSRPPSSPPVVPMTRQQLDDAIASVTGTRPTAREAIHMQPLPIPVPPAKRPDG